MILGAFLITFIFMDKGIQIDERIRVNYVALDVVAFHKKTGPVTDLTLEDFIVKLWEVLPDYVPN